MGHGWVKTRLGCSRSAKGSRLARGASGETAVDGGETNVHIRVDDAQIFALTVDRVVLSGDAAEFLAAAG